MKKYFMKLKLSYRLFLIIIICFLIPYIVLFFSSYWRAESIIKEKTEEVEGENICQVGSIIENMCLNIVNASNYLVSLNIYDRLSREASSSYDFLTAYQTADGLIQNINNSLLNAKADINVFTENALLYSTDSSLNVDYQEFYNSYIKENDSLFDYSPYFSGVHPSYTKYKEENYISCIRKISDLRKEDCYLVISMPVSAFESTLNSAMGTMTLLDSTGNVICQSLGKRNDYSDIAAIALQKSASDTSDILVRFSVKETNEMVTVYPVSVYNWKLLNITSAASLYEEMYELRNIILILSLILIAICLSITFYCIYHQLKPLLLLKEDMEAVGRGNLKTSVTVVDSQDEIGILTQTFHNMLGQINALIDAVKRKEQKENELKFEILLAQINPHFLFNTLNSIKWMAVVAHTDNIATTITSLGRLLEISMNKVNDILPVREELTNIKSYIQIQKVRYPGRFEVQYDIDKNILSCSTPKLILQPLVENSILHNIEHQDFLIIRISAKRKGNLLEFTVWDNGYGIPPEKLKTILQSDKESKTGQVFKGIGVRNVYDRIQLIYGSSYGLRYESDGQSYTKAILAFPEKSCLETKGEELKNDQSTDSR